MSSYTREPYPDDRFRVTSWRPTSVTVIAILNLVFGTLGLIGGLCSGVGQVISAANIVPQPPPGPRAARTQIPPDFAERQQRFLEQEIPFYKVTTMTIIALGFPLSAMLIAAGIGLLGMRRRARKLSLIYGIVSIVYQVAGFAYTLTLQLPAMNTFFRQLEKEIPGSAQSVMFLRLILWFTLALVPIGLIYPIVVLVVLTRRKVVAAFEHQPALPDLSDRERENNWPEPPAGAFTR
jgi:hypothetical protein